MDGQIGHCQTIRRPMVPKTTLKRDQRIYRENPGTVKGGEGEANAQLSDAKIHGVL